MRKIAVFGGTFDPIHYGHVSLIIDLHEKGDFEEVWVCPASVNPFKQAEEQKSAQIRLQSVEQALDSLPFARAKDLEVKRGGVSYTVDTLRALITSHPDCRFCWVMGMDTALGFESWKEYRVILELADVIVADRSGANVDELPDCLRGSLFPTRRLDISSSDIRDRLRRDLPVHHLMP